LLRQAGPRPDIAPAILRGDVLERHHEIVGRGHGTVDIVRAEHGFADLHALVIELLIAWVGLCFAGHRLAPPFKRRRSIAQVGLSGRRRWPAPWQAARPNPWHGRVDRGPRW